MNNKLNAYLNTEELGLSGTEFEKLWFHRAITVLTLIQAGKLDVTKTNQILISMCGNLTWIRLNLNPGLSTAHREILYQIYDSCIVIIQGYLLDRDPEYLSIVIKSLETIADPYTEH